MNFQKKKPWEEPVRQIGDGLFMKYSFNRDSLRNVFFLEIGGG